MRLKQIPPLHSRMLVIEPPAYSAARTVPVERRSVLRAQGRFDTLDRPRKATRTIVTTGRKIGAGEGIRILDPDLGKDQR
jgi:hypothetical protein